MSCEYMVSTMESRYCFELAFSERGLTAGWRVKSGEKYWKYSVSTGRSVSSSWIVSQAVLSRHFTAAIKISTG